MDFIGQLFIAFGIWLVVPIFIFCVIRVLFSIAYGFGKLVRKLVSSSAHNKKVFIISRRVGAIALHIPIFFLPGFLLTENLFQWKIIPGWFGEPISIPFFLVGSLAAVIAGIYSSDDYNFWKCMYRLR